MSIINSTLIVQAFHFFIAYVAIKYFFFKQAYHEIAAQDSLQESLVRSVQVGQMQVERNEQNLQEHWRRARDYFLRHRPSFKEEPLIGGPVVPSIVMPIIEKTQIENSAPAIAHVLMQKVDHGK
jgi:hypothetical protein